MNTRTLGYKMAALLVPCFLGAASAQGRAFSELLGAANAQVESPEISAPVDTNSGGEFSYIDKSHVVPDEPLQAALRYYKAARSALGNPYYLSVMDFTQSAASKRFYIIDMRTGDVARFLVAHGRGSDPDHTGYATIFSNQEDTHASSLGFYKTAETYNGENGYSLRLDGLSSTNSNARVRAIVIHGADYVSAQGRSWGCPAVEPSQLPRIVGMIKGGSLIYAYRRGARNDIENTGSWGRGSALASQPKINTAAWQAAASGAYQPSSGSGNAEAVPAGGLPEEVANMVRPPAEEDPDAQYFDLSKVSGSRDISGKIPYLDIVKKVSKEEGVDQALILAIIQQESRFNPKAHSPVGALGLMQVMPETARFLGVKDTKTLLTPEVCIKCGVRYLKYLWAEFGSKDLASLSAEDINRSDVIDTIAAYNAGPGNVKKYGGVPPFQETRNYTVKVSDYFTKFKNM
jgi:soluble lytic murein transglycosylase-like protein